MIFFASILGRYVLKTRAVKMAAKALRSPAEIEAEELVKREKKRAYQREYQREWNRRRKQAALKTA